MFLSFVYLEMVSRDEVEADQPVVLWVLSLSFLKIGATFAFLHSLGTYSYFMGKDASP